MLPIVPAFTVLAIIVPELVTAPTASDVNVPTEVNDDKVVTVDWTIFAYVEPSFVICQLSTVSFHFN